MRRARRVAAILGAVLLGIATWLIVMLCMPAHSDLRLSRQLSTGGLVTRISGYKPLFFGRIVFGPATLSARYSQPEKGSFGLLPRGVVAEAATENEDERLWHIRLDPTDKSWDIKVTERRYVYLRLGRKLWRIGTKTRVFRTNRTEARPQASITTEESDSICRELVGARQY